jgi:hypothetical protein
VLGYTCLLLSLQIHSKASFRLRKNFNPMNSTIFVLFDKYCSIVHQLGSKDSSRDFQLNCVISYFFTYIYYFMHGSQDWCDGERVKKFQLLGGIQTRPKCFEVTLTVATATLPNAWSY